MFDWPLPIGRASTYAELAVGPEALSEDIREAKAEAILAVEAARARLDKERAEAEHAFPDLAEARRSLKALQAEAGAAPAKLARARDRLHELEDTVVRSRPSYADVIKEYGELDNRVVEVNKITIDNPEAREKYDAEHPPFSFLKIEDATQDGFLETRIATGLLRRDLSAFIEAAGEDIFHPSDLFRQDFSADHSYHRLLDGEKS